MTKQLSGILAIICLLAVTGITIMHIDTALTMQHRRYNSTMQMVVYIFLNAGSGLTNEGVSWSTALTLIGGNVFINSLTASQIVETDASKKLVSVAKGTAHNKSFAGSGAATTVARSDHNHSGVYQPLLSLISEYAGMVSFNFGSTWMSFGNTSNGQTISTSGNLQLSPASGSGIVMNGWEDHSGAYTYNNIFLEDQGAGPIPTADHAAIKNNIPI